MHKISARAIALLFVCSTSPFDAGAAGGLWLQGRLSPAGTLRLKSHDSRQITGSFARSGSPSAF